MRFDLYADARSPDSEAAGTRIIGVGPGSSPTDHGQAHPVPRDVEPIRFHQSLIGRAFPKPKGDFHCLARLAPPR